MSDRGRELLATWMEGGYRLRAYLDSGKPPVLTIGAGHALTKAERATGSIVIGNRRVFYGAGIALPDALELFAQDIAPVEALVSRLIEPDAPAMKQAQFDALVAFVFNIGDEAFERPERQPPGSNVLRAINAGNLAAVPDAMRGWVYDNHVRVKGLVNRREKEITVWGGDLSGKWTPSTVSA